MISGQRLEIQVILHLKSPQNATLWMKKLRAVGFPWSHSYFSANPLLFAWRDWAWGQPIRKNICQQLAPNLLTGDVCPFVRHGTGGVHLVRKEHEAYFSTSVNYIPGLQCRYGRKRGDWEKWFLVIWSIICFKHMVSLTGRSPEWHSQESTVHYSEGKCALC